MLSINKFILRAGIFCQGSGKTSFLNSLIGEVYIDDNCSDRSKRVNINKELLKDGFAYVTQDYWIEASTIKENILFGLDYDEQKYNQIVCEFICSIIYRGKVFF
jgi:ABC-type transport system involved in cytochrome bd biosynthesis fused ATPase/permease subunit